MASPFDVETLLDERANGKGLRCSAVRAQRGRASRFWMWIGNIDRLPVPDEVSSKPDLYDASLTAGQSPYLVPDDNKCDVQRGRPTG